MEEDNGVRSEVMKSAGRVGRLWGRSKWTVKVGPQVGPTIQEFPRPEHAQVVRSSTVRT